MPSSEPKRPILPGELSDDRPNVGILLRRPLQEIVRRIAEGLAEAGFDDVRPAHTAGLPAHQGGGFSPLRAC